MGNKLRLNSSLIITSILPDTNALFIAPKNFIFYSLSRFRMIFKTIIVFLFKKGNTPQPCLRKLSQSGVTLAPILPLFAFNPS